MTLPTSKIIATLPTLSRADLAAVRGAADALLGPVAAPNQGAATPLFDAVTRALGLRLGFAAFQATGTYKQFKRGEQAVELFMAEAFPTVSDKPTRQALLGLIVECLMDDLKARHVPLSMGVVSSNLERAPQVFRDTFPGYIEGGASQLILNRITRGKTNGSS